MPQAPLKPCAHPGCPELVRGTPYCQRHRVLHKSRIKADRRHYDKARGTAAQRGYDGRWQKARQWFLRRHPVCARCGQPATVVDHIKPHRGDKELFWDTSNWQPLCKRCHDKKTASEDRPAQAGAGPKVIEIIDRPGVHLSVHAVKIEKKK